MPPKANNGYPFTSRNQVVARIASEPAFAVEAVHLIAERNAWAASHKTRATKLVARLSEGGPAPEDLAEAAALVTPYARTLARILREKEIAERPELMAQGALFGLVRLSPVVETASQAEAAPPTVVETADEPVAPVVKKRGRPVGSKNRVRPEPEARRKRRS